MQITFRITDKCNIACEYCHWNDYIHYDTNDIYNTIDSMYKYLDKINIKEFVLYFHGGEPSFHPDILNILKYIRNKRNIKTIIEFQTNLTMNKQLYIDMLRYIDKYSISLHLNELHVKKLYDRFVENITILTKDNLQNFDIMLEKVTTQSVEQYHKQIKCFLHIAKIAQNSEMIYGFCHYDGTSQTAIDHKDFYDQYNITENKYYWENVMDKPKTTNELFMNGLNCSGKKCEVGKKFLIINGDGNVFYCGIHMTNNLKQKQNKTYCGEYKEIVNINDKNAITKLKILTSIDTICKWNYCGGDFYARKW